jgi:hypothetical protein
MYEHPSESTVRHAVSSPRVLLHNPRFVRMAWMGISADTYPCYARAGHEDKNGNATYLLLIR